VSLAAFSAEQATCHASLLPMDCEQPQTVRQISLGKFVFAYENVLGTSMELILRTGSPMEAAHCEWRVLAEIERLRGILSTYGPASEISRVMAGAPVQSPELAELLDAYAQWTNRTLGAINLNMAGVIRLWKDAAISGSTPSTAGLSAAAKEYRAYNVDALGKGYIIDRVVTLARQLAPSGLLNIGGDIRAWGQDSWLIGVANPKVPAENAPPVAQLQLREGAIATSGGYARSFIVGGRSYSHLLDPRTCQPLAQLASATVVARDCITANALSTAACVLEPAMSIALCERWGAFAHLLVDASGSVTSTVGLSDMSVTGTASTTAPASIPAPQGKPSEESNDSDKKSAAKPTDSTAWTKDHQVTINITLKTIAATGNRAVKRPYVAIWVENSEKKHIRTLAVWGNNDRYLSSLTTWWATSDDADLDAIKAITRATRPAGQYSVTWDGLDEKGKGLPAGDYKIFIEINREHGRHVTGSSVIHCGGDNQSIDLAETTESEASKITYGPKTTTVAVDKK